MTMGGEAGTSTSATASKRKWLKWAIGVGVVALIVAALLAYPAFLRVD